MLRSLLIAQAVSLQLCATGLALAQGVPVEEASDPARAAAEESFYAGDEAFDVQKYQLALQYFRESYEAVASPNTRLMIARCLLELGRLDESYEEYVALIAAPGEGEDYKRTNAIARKERSALLSRLAWVTVDTSDLPAESQVEIGGRERSPDAQLEAIAVTPGKTEVVATSPSGDKARAVVHLAAGRQLNVPLVLGQTITLRALGDEQEEEPSSPAAQEQKEPEPPPVVEDELPATGQANLRPWGSVAAGVGVAGLVVFAGYGAKSRSRFNRLDDDCVEGVCPPGSQEDIDVGQRAQTTANIGLVVGALGAATAVTFFLLDSHQRGGLSLNVGPRTISLRGAF